jgi:hypothetical protein
VPIRTDFELGKRRHRPDFIDPAIVDNDRAYHAVRKILQRAFPKRRKVEGFWTCKSPQGDWAIFS